MKKCIVACLVLLIGLMSVDAQIFFRNGIAYNVTITAEPLTVEVVSQSNEYFGVVEIPYEVPFNGEIYTVTRIADGAFQYCSGLTTVILPYSITSIGDYAFSGCTSLTSITLPMSLYWIGQGAFWGSGLSSIIIPSSVNQIGPGAFSNCTNLTNLVVTQGNISYASVNNMLLTYDLSQLICCPGGLTGTIIVFNTVKQINYQAFGNCEGITAVIIPGSVNSIGPWAFQNCYSLTTVQLNDGLTTISAGAFESCEALDTLILPNTVQYIGANAFEDCKSLSVLSLGNGIVRIGSRAFEDCEALTSLTIPSAVVRVGDRLIKGCTNLTSMTFLPIMPPVIFAHTFENNQQNLPIYVPSASVNLYRNAEHWNKQNNIQAIRK